MVIRSSLQPENGEHGGLAKHTTEKTMVFFITISIFIDAFPAVVQMKAFVSISLHFELYFVYHRKRSCTWVDLVKQYMSSRKDC